LLIIEPDADTQNVSFYGCKKYSQIKRLHYGVDESLRH